jgi:UDP-glucose 4-epimerase
MIRADTYLVTGACGAIFSNFVRRLLKWPHVKRVVCVDDLSNGFKWLLPEDPRVEFVCANVAYGFSLGLMNPLVKPIVVHGAAHFANARSWDEPITDTMTNVVGTVNMLEMAAGLESPLFIFASAGCAVAHENSPYQVSKTAGEAYCRCYHMAGKVPTAVFRFMNSHGPGELPGRYRNVIPRFIWALMNDEPITIYGDGTDRRDFVYVEDVVEDLVNAEPNLMPKEIGTGELTKVGELATKIATLLGKKDWKIRYEARRGWDHAGRAAIVDRRPRISLDEGLLRTVEWFRANEAKIRESVKG